VKIAFHGFITRNIRELKAALKTMAMAGLGISINRKSKTSEE
jgi:hypothetical protein